ncbi:MAG: fumarylacetoacetate hydrolase family protein [Sandaracinaceae bacterium]
MKLATLRDGTRDGALIVADASGTRYVSAASVAPTLQAALDRWDDVETSLRALSAKAADGEALDTTRLMAPLPRAYEWVDGSAYINHIVLVRKARNAEPPETLETDPLVYQGGSGVLLGPNDPIQLPDPEWGLDFEAEICVVLGDTPQATTKGDANQHIKLLMLANDVTLRNLIPPELKKGFGFFNSKPATAFSPFAITPDELGDAWEDGRLNLTMQTHLNGALAGDPAAGPEMHFSFLDLIEHVAKSRAFTAGTILGSGTISNVDEARGVSCLAERRMREIIKDGAPTTEFLKVGDRVRIEMLDGGGRSLFGAIEQTVVPFEKKAGA